MKEGEEQENVEKREKNDKVDKAVAKMRCAASIKEGERICRKANRAGSE